MNQNEYKDAVDELRAFCDKCPGKVVNGDYVTAVNFKNDVVKSLNTLKKSKAPINEIKSRIAIMKRYYS